MFCIWHWRNGGGLHTDLAAPTVRQTGFTKGTFEFLWSLEAMLYMVQVVFILGLTGWSPTLVALFKCLLGYKMVNRNVVGLTVKMVAQVGEVTPVIARVEVRVTSHPRRQRGWRISDVSPLSGISGLSV